MRSFFKRFDRSSTVPVHRPNAGGTDLSASAIAQSVTSLLKTDFNVPDIIKLAGQDGNHEDEICTLLEKNSQVVNETFSIFFYPEDYYGKITLLEYAIRQENVVFFRLLLEAGADPHTMNGKNQNIFDILACRYYDVSAHFSITGDRVDGETDLWVNYTETHWPDHRAMERIYCMLCWLIAFGFALESYHHAEEIVFLRAPGITDFTPGQPLFFSISDEAKAMMKNSLHSLQWLAGTTALESRIAHPETVPAGMKHYLTKTLPRERYEELQAMKIKKLAPTA